MAGSMSTAVLEYALEQVINNTLRDRVIEKQWEAVAFDLMGTCMASWLKVCSNCRCIKKRIYVHVC